MKPLSFVVAFAWTFGVTALLVAGVQTTAALRPGSENDLVSLGAWELIVYLVGSLAVLRVHGQERQGLDALGIRPASASLLLLGLALGLALQVPAESLRRLVEWVAPPTAEELAARAALLAVDSPTRAAVVLLVTACLVPLVEELFFRGALFTTLRRQHGGFASAAMVAVCFVVGHADPTNWLPIALVAGVLSHLRLVSGSLLPGLGLHVAFNAVTVASVLTGASSVTAPIELPWWMTLVGWGATAALVYAVQYVGVRSARAVAARQEDES